MAAPRKLRLLSLDGGGVRGLSSLYILRDIMWRVAGEPPEGQERTIPKPCDYFDLIGGTSTGGLIAVMLGRLEMTVDDCIKAYVTLSKEIFSQPKQPSMLSKLPSMVGVEMEANYDASKFEAIIKGIITSAKLPEDALLKNVGAKCKVYVSLFYVCPARCLALCLDISSLST